VNSIRGTLLLVLLGTLGTLMAVAGWFRGRSARPGSTRLLELVPHAPDLRLRGEHADVDQARRRQGDGGRGGVEIAPVGGARDPVDVVMFGRRDDGGANVGGELIPRGGVAGGGLGVA